MATTRWSRGIDMILPVGLLGAIAIFDMVLPPQIIVSGAFAFAAIVASAITTVRRTAAVAAAAVALAALSALWNQNFATAEWWIRLAMTVVVAAGAIVLAAVRVGRERKLHHMTAIAEAAQRALLRAMPSSIQSLRFAARYVSATQEAFVGGDLYEVIETPAGVRVIVGDARGKGLEAVQMAATVLAAFRRAAFTESSLAKVATDLDRVVAAVAGDEDFVTAVLAEFHGDGSVTLVNCGHPAPLLVTSSESGSLLDSTECQPPLGLGPTPSPMTHRVPEGGRLLFYTDGLIETRDPEGNFLHLDGRASAALRTGSLGDALDTLLTILDDHSADGINDDVALLIVERRSS